MVKIGWEAVDELLVLLFAVDCVRLNALSLRVAVDFVVEAGLKGEVVVVAAPVTLASAVGPVGHRPVRQVAVEVVLCLSLAAHPFCHI